MIALERLAAASPNEHVALINGRGERERCSKSKEYS